jgi:Co/Zn/Cd efflux system component
MPRHAKRTRINMLSALLHIGADAMRSTTTIASAAIMISNPAWDSNKIDSIAALVVSSLVLLTGTRPYVAAHA